MTRQHLTRYMATACIVVAVLLLLGCPPIGPNNPSAPRFTSADPDGRNGGWDLPFYDGLRPEADAPTDDAGGEAPAEREVQEPDVYRVSDDGLLYVLNQYRGLTLVDIGAQTIVSQVPTYGYPRDLYVEDGRAYVLVSNAREFQADGGTLSASVASRLYIVDVTTPSQAAISARFDLAGNLVDSRLVGDVLYAVCAEYSYYYPMEDRPIGINQVAKQQTGGSWVTSVNVADPANIYKVQDLSVEGEGSIIQATNEAIFVAIPEWHTWSDTTTQIRYVDISDPAGTMVQRGAVDIPGEVADRFKLDAYEGVLRVVSSRWADGNRETYVSTIDLADPDNLSQLGQLHLAEASGEQLFATRFDGDMAYIVTFFVVDPLFVVDLSDPASPQLAGELKVPGWSTHIEPRGDRLVALGVDDTGPTNKVSVSLFDVSDPAAPGLIERVSFGDNWTWSSAYGDVKAFTVLDDAIVVPFSGWTAANGQYDRLQFISYDAHALTLRGTADVQGQVQRTFSYGGSYYTVTTEQLAVLDTSADLGTVSVGSSLVLAENVVDFIPLGDGQAAQISVPAFGGPAKVSLVNTSTRASSGSVSVEAGYFSGAFLMDPATLIVVGEVYDYETAQEHYTVARVDLSAGGPTVSASTRVDVRPYYSWWGPWNYMDFGRPAKQAYDYWMPYPYHEQDKAFLVDGTLVLRGYADRYEQVFGDAQAREGLALVNVADDLSYTTVGLGYEHVAAVNAADKLYVSIKENASRPLANDTCAFYVVPIAMAPPRAADPVNVPGAYLRYDPATGILLLRDLQWNGAPPIEPGEQVEPGGSGESGANPDTASSGKDVIAPWPGYGTTNFINAVAWDGQSAVAVLDSVELPDYVDALAVTNSAVFFTRYDEGLWLQDIATASDGSLMLGDGIKAVGPQNWGTLLDAQGADAYLSIDGGAVARYRFNGAAALDAWVETMGGPQSIRFGTGAAWIATGYSGVVALP